MINKNVNINRNVKTYLITILISSIIAGIFALFLQLELLFRVENYVNNKELETANLSKFLTIDQLEKRLAHEPTNHIVSIRLAQLHESLKQYSKANEYYKNALNLSNHSDYSLYVYALFCAKRNLVTLATSLCEELSDNNKKTIEYKTKIYETIADNFMAQNEYSAANKAYQVAYKYAKNLKDKDYFKSITKKYSDSFVKLADSRVENKLYEQAISDLNNALNLNETPLIAYKLGLIYKETDKVKAETYMSKAISQNVFLVNPYIYNNLLQDLIDSAVIEQNQGKLNFYTLKQLNFKKKLERSYLYKNDIQISKGNIVKETKFFTKRKKRYLTFDIRNNTQVKLNDLYIQIELFVNSNKYTLEKKVIGTTNKIEPYETINDYRIVLDDSIPFKDVPKSNDVVIKYYAKKLEQAPWTLIKIDFLNL